MPRTPDNLAAVCRVVASADLRGLPVYILRGAETGWERMPGCAGFTMDSLDLILREQIGDRWQGRGVAMVLYDLRKARTDEVRDENLLGVALHELAHAIKWADEIRQAPPPSAEIVLFEKQCLAKATHGETIPDVTAAQIATASMRGHDADFMRRALHLRWRAEALGFEVPLPTLALERETHAPPWQYLRALGNEPERLQEMTLAEIEEQPYPAAFEALWMSDLERFCRQREAMQ